jgi:gephyrin
MVEDTILRSITEDGKEEGEVEILADGMQEGENVREVGSDVTQGEIVLRKGDVVSTVGGEIGLLASVGRGVVKVYNKVTVGVLSTGDEVVDHLTQRELGLGEIWDSNRPALLTAVKAQGFPTVDLGIARDKPGELESKLMEALQVADVIITTGGVSMGEMDLLKPTIEQSLKGKIHFGRVAMKPGKPTTFATVQFPDSTQRKKLIFALPGNPASALVTLHLFVLPSLRKSQGRGQYDLPQVNVTVDEDIPLDPRPEFRRVVVRFDAADGRLHATGTGGQRSSRIGSARGANAVLVMPSLKDVSEKRRELGCLPKGEDVKAILWGQVASG